MKFLDALIKAKDKNCNIVIPDIKCFSPKEGDLMKGRDPSEYAKLLEEAGAPVLSVVTEEEEFHGSLDILKKIAEKVDVPILRKDFIHTKEDLIETKEYGASAILLMCSCLTRDELFMLYEEALKLGLDPFVETHVKEDFELVNELGAKLVGINNRDILVLERDEGDVSNTIELASLAPKDAFLVTESSIKNSSEVRAAIKAGADAALVGTAILNSEYTQSFYKMMCRKTSLKICGLMNEEDIKTCVELGVDRIGMVAEYPVNVPWNLDRDKVFNLRQSIPSGHQACVVMGGEADKLKELIDYIKPDMVQLHYKESLDTINEISECCKKNNTKIIKTVPITKEACLEQSLGDDVKTSVKMLSESCVSEFLVDARTKDNANSKNLKLDVELAKDIISISSKPVTIAGGITKDNLKEIVLETGCLNVDIMGGSEDEPGHKNRETIKRIIEIVENL